MEIIYNLAEGKIILHDDVDTCLRYIEEGQAVILIVKDPEQLPDISGIPYAVTLRAIQAGNVVDEVYLNRVIQRFKHQPWHILDTERCSLREMTLDDMDAYYQVYSHPDVRRYTLGPDPDREKEREFIRKYIQNVYEGQEMGSWGIFLKSSGELIGEAGFHMRRDFQSPELNYTLAKPYQGQGYATEVCKAILAYGRDSMNFRRVHALVRQENMASIALLWRIGFQLSDEKFYQLDGIDYLRFEREL